MHKLVLCQPETNLCKHIYDDDDDEEAINLEGLRGELGGSIPEKTGGKRGREMM